MKFLYYTLLFVLAINAANAQSKTISATIQDETNRFLHYVVVEDSKYGTTAFSDSVGIFNINVQPDSKLTFQLSGYRDTSINAANITSDSQIVLKSAVNMPVETEYSSIRPAFNQQGLLEIPKTKVNVAGSRYLSDVFFHGFFETKNGRKIYNTSYLYNYDKISGVILLCTDNRSVVKIYADQIKSLTLVNNYDERLDFEKVPEIDHGHFIQVLAKGLKYKIYKSINTKFVAADFQNVALGQVVGQDHDEYTDDINYYVLDVAANQVQKISIKNSSIRAVFAKESEKIKEFMSKDSDSADEQYIIDLANYLNN
jgi:hypothetical protein